MVYQRYVVQDLNYLQEPLGSFDNMFTHGS